MSRRTRRHKQNLNLRSRNLVPQSNLNAQLLRASLLLSEVTKPAWVRKNRYLSVNPATPRPRLRGEVIYPSPRKRGNLSKYLPLISTVTGDTPVTKKLSRKRYANLETIKADPRTRQCVKRKQRREILFATGHGGRGYKTPKHLTNFSKETC